MKCILFILFIYCSISAKDIKAEIDYSIYYISEDSIALEIYYEFESYNLDYVYLDSSYVSTVKFNVNLKSILINNNYDWKLESKEFDLKDNRLVFGIKKIKLPKSQYKLSINFYVESDTNLSGNRKFDVIPKSKSNYLSDIYFATRITKKDSAQIAWSDVFSKGDFYVIPNSSKQYFSDRATLLSYVEIYRPKQFSEKSFIIEYKIIDAINTTKKVVSKTFLTEKSLVDTNINSDFISDNINIPIPDLATGVYFLEVKLFSDKNDKVIDISSKKFFYLNFDKAPELNIMFTEDELFERSEFITLNDTTINREFDKIKYLMTKGEKVRWDELSDLKAKQRAIFNYWRIRDSDTTTNYNETKEEFDKAVKYADEYYTYMKGFEGWRTDRGKVLLKYGFPMLVERYPRNGEKIPCEIWYYGEGGGGAYFYFVDKTGYGNFVLVHSTVFGETQNEYWMEEYNPAVNFDMNIKRSDHYFK